MMENRLYKIYCLTNTINNKKYIGMTKQDIPKRCSHGKGYKKGTKIREAIETYGWDTFDIEVLYSTYSREEASLKEAYYVGLFNTVNEGYNRQSGGLSNFTIKFDKDFCKTRSELMKGKHISTNTEFKKGNKAANQKPVICIETGTVYENCTEAKNKTNTYHIGDVCNGRRNTANGYHWRFVEEDYINEENI